MNVKMKMDKAKYGRKTWTSAVDKRRLRDPAVDNGENRGVNG